MMGKHKVDYRRCKAQRERRRHAKALDRRRKHEVKRAYGRKAVGPCTRKRRYDTEARAMAAAVVASTSSGTEISHYHCDLCGGWHLTSHPRDKTGREPQLRPSEILTRSREAAARIDRIDEELRLLEERVGPQGYSTGVHSHASILDPMRKVIDLVDQSEELWAERAECEGDIRNAWSIVAGIAAYSKWGMEAEQLVVEYFIYARDLDEIAESTSYSIDVNRRAIEVVLEEADAIGVARLRSAVRRD